MWRTFAYRLNRQSDEVERDVADAGHQENVSVRTHLRRRALENDAEQGEVEEERDGVDKRVCEMVNFCHA